MKEKLELKVNDKADWSKQLFLTEKQAEKIMLDKLERAKIQSMATKYLRQKVGM